MTASAKNIDDMYEIIASHVPVEHLDSFMAKMLALRGNKSFDTTVELLAHRHAVVTCDLVLERSLHNILTNKRVPVPRVSYRFWCAALAAELPAHLKNVLGDEPEAVYKAGQTPAEYAKQITAEYSA